MKFFVHYYLNYNKIKSVKFIQKKSRKAKNGNNMTLLKVMLVCATWSWIQPLPMNVKKKRSRKRGTLSQDCATMANGRKG
jgi:hypothetical protein